MLGLEDIDLNGVKDGAKDHAERGAKANAFSGVVEGSTQKLKKSPSQKEEIKRNPKKGKSHPRGKKYQMIAKNLDAGQVYSISDAVKKVRTLMYANFTESVELHINVEKQGLKGEVELPHSTGKTVRVQIVDDATMERIEAGKIDFDVLIAHPSYMPKLAKFARILGPKGLMPNPKAGTVTPNPEQVAKKFEKGTLQWRTEPKQAVIHQMIGKVTSDDTALVENAIALLNSVGKANIRSAFIKTTMSPSLRLDISQI